MSESKIVISGTGLYTPEHSVSNDELVTAFNTYVDSFNAANAREIEAGNIEALVYSNSDFIVKASGIKSRYVMDKSGVVNPEVMHPVIEERADDEMSLHCEISVKAITEALAQANKDVKDVDAIIVSCSGLPRMYPALAIEVQQAMGVEGFAYDMNVACSSATFGIQAAYNALKAKTAKCVVVVNPEITSGHLNYTDRDSHFIFGDVCTAIVMEASDTVDEKVKSFEILGIELKTVFSNAIRNNGSYMTRCATEPRADDKLFYQEGRKVFKEVVPMVSSLIAAHLEENDLSSADLKRLWLHQANINMNVLIAKKVMSRDVVIEEAPVILDEYANTSSAGSIIAFHKYRDDFEKDEKGVICSFGAGYSIGNVIVKRC